MWARAGDTLRAEFTTSSPANGASTSADSLPTAVLARNGTTDGAVTVTVTLIETGRYKASCTIPVGYAAGDVVTMRVTAIVSSVTGRDTIAELRLQAVDFTAEIADQLFEEGTDYKLEVNSDGSVDSGAVLSSGDLASIAASINASTLTANQIAAALQDTLSVVLLGPLMTGTAHRMVRGSSYTHTKGTAPYIRVAKANYALTSATAQFRMKLERQDAVTATGTIISIDENYWEVYADLAATKTDDMQPGTGIDQFWVTLSGGDVVCLSENYLEVIAGIGVA